MWRTHYFDHFRNGKAIAFPCFSERSFSGKKSRMCWENGDFLRCRQWKSSGILTVEPTQLSFLESWMDIFWLKLRQLSNVGLYMLHMLLPELCPLLYWITLYSNSHWPILTKLWRFTFGLVSEVCGTRTFKENDSGKRCNHRNQGMPS